MNRAANTIPKFSSAPVAEALASDRWVSDLTSSQRAQQKWVAALFIQFRFLYSHANGDQEALLDQYRTLLEQAVGYHHGDVVAHSKDAGLALFSGPGRPQEYTRNAIDAATLLMAEARATNSVRLAQDLSPLRLGIGVDAGMLAATTCNRHPRMDPGLQRFLEKARRLSELNYQTPFPAIFVSHAVADTLERERHYAIQNLGSVAVENQPDPLTVFAVIDQ